MRRILALLGGFLLACGSSDPDPPGDNPCPTSAPSFGDKCTTSRTCYYGSATGCGRFYCETDDHGNYYWTGQSALPEKCKP